MKWYWYIIIYLIIEFILHMIVNIIARKKGCYEIMKTISDKEVKSEYNLIYYTSCIVLVALLMLLGSSYVLAIIFFVILLILAPFCNKLALFMKAMEMKETNAEVDYSISGKEKNRIDAREDIKNTVATIGMYSVISGASKRRKK